MKQDSWFNKKRYGIPFGKYSSPGASEFPSNEYMVGREGPRAALINFLTHGGPQGAYLVTGRRGVGKTSFVNYCLNEYKKSVFDRFLRTNVARSMWDLAWLSFVAILGILFIIAYNQYTVLLIRNLIDKSPDNYIVALTVAPYVGIIVVFLVYSKRIIEALLHYLDLSVPNGITSILFVLICTGFFVRYGNPGPDNFFRLILIVCVCYSVTIFLSYNHTNCCGFHDQHKDAKTAIKSPEFNS